MTMFHSSSSQFNSNELKFCSYFNHAFEGAAVTSNYWDLDICGHRLCAEYFTSFSLSKMVKKECPTCKRPPASIIHTSFKLHGRGNNKQLRRVEKDISLLHPDDEPDFLTIQTRHCLPITVCLDPTSFDNDKFENEEKLKLIFRKLKIVLVPKETVSHSSSASQSQRPKSHRRDTFHGKNFFDKMDRIIEDDSSILLQCLSSLALGNDCVFSFLDKDRKRNF